MRTKMCLLLLAFLAVSCSALAQDPKSGLTDQEIQARDWAERYRQWAEKNQNHAVSAEWWEKLLHLQPSLALEPAPLPPTWLSAVCAAENVPAGFIKDACRLIKDSFVVDDPLVAQVDRDIKVARAKGEEKPHSSFLKNVYVDGIWFQSAYPFNSKFMGVVGGHYAVSLPGSQRVKFFIPPGVMLVCYPGASGRRKCTTGFTIGATIKLFDLYGLGHPLTGNMSFTIMRLLGDRDATFAANSGSGGIPFAGLSLGF